MLFSNLLPLFLKKDMFRQFRMINWLQMPMVMALCHGWLVGFVALRPKSTAMIIARRSVHLTTLFPGQA